MDDFMDYEELKSLGENIESTHPGVGRAIIALTDHIETTDNFLFGTIGELLVGALGFLLISVSLWVFRLEIKIARLEGHAAKK